MSNRFKDFDLISSDVLMRALENLDDGGFRSIRESKNSMLDELKSVEFYTVVLKGYPEGTKIKVIKELRNAVPELSLTDAKALSESMGRLFKYPSYEEADKVASIIRTSGATVEVI